MKRGIWFALGAYFLWGILPIYWKWLHTVPALQVIGHRIIWSFPVHLQPGESFPGSSP
jgi:chloramphenicol-sensitive protein RarD